MLDTIAYSNVWEDYNLVKNTLEIQENDVVVSICSSGDQIFNILSEESCPSEVHCIDMSKEQIYLFQLTKSVVQELSLEEFLYFVGVDDSYLNERSRVMIFEQFTTLDKEVYEFWKNHLEHIDQGVKACGKLEYMIKNMFHEMVVSIYLNYSKSS